MSRRTWLRAAWQWPPWAAASTALEPLRATVGHSASAWRTRLAVVLTALVTAVLVPAVWRISSVFLVGRPDDQLPGSGARARGERPANILGGGVAALVAPFAPVLVPLQISLDPRSWATAIFDAIAGALLDFIGTAFKGVIMQFLIMRIPPSPSAQPNAPLNVAYSQNLEYALMLLPVVVLLGLVTAPVARRERAAFRRLLWRLILVFVGLGVSRPFLRLVGQVVNVTTQLVAPSSYAVGFGGQWMQQGLASVGATGLVLALGMILLDIGIIILVLLVVAILFLREFLFQLVYAGFPLLVVAWWLDWGPLRYSKQIANLVFSVTGLLVALGPVFALALQIGCTIAGGGGAGACFPGNPTVSTASAPDLWRRFMGWATGLALTLLLPLRTARMMGMPMMGGSGGGGGGSGTSEGAGAGGGGGRGGSGGDGRAGGGTPVAAAGGGGAAAATAAGPEARPPQAAEQAMGGARQQAGNLAEEAHSVADIGRDIGASTAQWGSRTAAGAGSAAATAAGYGSERAEASMRSSGQRVSASVGGGVDRLSDAAGTAKGGVKAADARAREAAGTAVEVAPEPAKTAAKTVGGAAYVAGRETAAVGRYIRNNPSAGVVTMGRDAINRVRSQQWSTPQAGGESGVSPSGARDDPNHATLGGFDIDVPPQEDGAGADEGGNSFGAGADPQDDTFSPGPDTDTYEEPPPGTVQLDDEFWTDRSFQSTLNRYTSEPAGGAGSGRGGSGSSASSGGRDEGGGGGEGSGGATATQEGDGPDYTQSQVDAATGDASVFWEEDDF